jgi:hypothetical protein
MKLFIVVKRSCFLMAQNKHWNDIDTRILAERVTMVETMALVGKVTVVETMVLEGRVTVVETMALVGRVKTAVSEGSG